MRQRGITKLGTDLRLCPAHVVDRVASDGDDALLVEGCDLVDGRHGDLGVGVVHDTLDGGTLNTQKQKVSN